MHELVRLFSRKPETTSSPRREDACVWITRISDCANTGKRLSHQLDIKRLDHPRLQTALKMSWPRFNTRPPSI
jgi:hypothetical protein